MDKVKGVSVVVTALNEEKNITATIENILRAFEVFNIEGEIIVVNDGSCDKTEDLVKILKEKNPKVKILSHSKPKGVGTSFWDGVDKAGGDFVLWMPGDNENDPLEILRYYKLLEQVDIVIPFVFNKNARSLFRNALSFIYRFIINTTFVVNFHYTNGTILYRKSILKELKFRSNGFFFQTDILIRAAKRGYLFAEVPYRLDVREHGISKAVSFPSLLHVASGYLRLLRDFYFKKDKAGEPGFAKDSLTAIRRSSG
ncbi:MAG: glycosyltransferase family 2 protein [Candidatus Omnitrophica bacterium]|nr:glycosyltransferase family 2 protein [Candidatus Omnitrophota bacterium]